MTEKKKAGRPKRTDEEIQKLCDKLITWAEKPNSLTFESFAANEMKVDRSTVNTWIEAYPPFSKAFKRAKNMLAARWMENGLKGKFNAYLVNQHFYQVSEEYKDWMRELKNKDQKDQIINVHLPTFDKKKEIK